MVHCSLAAAAQTAAPHVYLAVVDSIGACVHSIAPTLACVCDVAAGAANGLQVECRGLLPIPVLHAHDLQVSTATVTEN